MGNPQPCHCQAEQPEQLSARNARDKHETEARWIRHGELLAHLFLAGLFTVFAGLPQQYDN